MESLFTYWIIVLFLSHSKLITNSFTWLEKSDKNDLHFFCLLNYYLYFICNWIHKCDDYNMAFIQFYLCTWNMYCDIHMYPFIFLTIINSNYLWLIYLRDKSLTMIHQLIKQNILRTFSNYLGNCVLVGTRRLFTQITIYSGIQIHGYYLVDILNHN